MIPYYVKKSKFILFTGGRIRTGLVSPETEEVNMTTVDNLVQLFGLHTLDVLKIDTEGNDNKVSFELSFFFKN